MVFIFKEPIAMGKTVTEVLGCWLQSVLGSRRRGFYLAVGS